MSDKQTQLQQGHEAETILNSEVFKLAFENLKSEYLNMWQESKELDSNLREKLYLAIKNLTTVEKHLRIIVEKGKITKSQLEKIK